MISEQSRTLPEDSHLLTWMWWAVAAGDDATYTNRLVAYRLQVRRELHRIATPLRISPPLLTLLSGFSGVNLALGPKRVHRSDRRTLTGASLAAETDESRDEESRLKAGCSQDWLPHNACATLSWASSWLSWPAPAPHLRRRCVRTGCMRRSALPRA